ncbi:DNA recombination protein RmuC [Pseudochelatococcus lubricantis]|uniref:DNA recombination protein RmuC homolog n=1 Tax=Pseudochelatococcus lubricantis TaxID=1538102 RepID=A0ABX0V464_9HYPH|nr:DNA recombination protein RmuC [Pseudochelatococcus lubricantis]NIJ59383.1 DNA recombination protein RmuC [Pseudochelatococcus lubricantis]
MNDAIVLFGHPVPLLHALAGAGAAAFVLLAAIAVQLAGLARARREEAFAAHERARELDARLAEMRGLQAQLTGRMQTVAEVFGTRQNDLARFLSERLEGLQHRVGQNLDASARHTAAHIASLNERLALIDAAQKNLSELSGHVLGLKDVLANKQARGAFGQGRMEAIVRDGLPANGYRFQPTLANGKRPDCLIDLPGDLPLAVDAKFPLEGLSAFREANDGEARRRAVQRVRNDIGYHIREVAEKYLLPGETQDIALLFVPSESIYADLHEHFDDLVQRAHRARVIFVSPSLLTMAIQLVQSLIRDTRMREEARVIQTEVGRLVDDIGRLRERVDKLDTHFRQAQEDVGQIRVSADKVARRGEAIAALDFEDAPPPRDMNGTASRGLPPRGMAPPAHSPE